MSEALFNLFLRSCWQTIYMVFLSSLIAAIVGLPWGILLVVTKKNGLMAHPHLNKILGSIVDIGRSIPFIILMIAIIPFTRFIVGTSIGTSAAIVPLSIAAMPFVARIVESACNDVSRGLIEAGIAMGASHWQIITKIYFRESLAGIIRGLTITAISLIGYSAMAGAVGGGGLGDLAIRYGYERFEPKVMLATIVVLIILVQLVQYTGDYFAKRVTH